ncbi:MAG: isochorismatase family protein [Methanomassiliicoccales archaeon]|nr:MAG: isochorismatase family protein [Methanomassiliicoccales archaeon]
MADEQAKSQKEDYLIEENLPEKTEDWLSDISIYAKKHSRFKFLPSASALIVIDMQRYFLSEDSHAYIPSSKAILSNVKNLIDAYRRYSLPVIFTRHSLKDNEEPGIMKQWWGDVIWDHSELSEIIASLSPLASEVVIRKTRYSAFYGTQLEDILIQNKIKTVVITGVMTHLCCETTAREAFMKDFEVYFVIDATATQNENLHLSSLRTLSNGFSIPVTTKKILSELEGMQP